MISTEYNQIPSYNALCIHISAFALPQPGADSLYSNIKSLNLLCSRPSIGFGRARAVSPILGSCDVVAGSSRRPEPFLLSFFLTIIITASCLCNFPSLPLSPPANYHSTECRHSPPPHQTHRPPLPRCHPIRCRVAPSGQAWSASTVLS